MKMFVLVAIGVWIAVVLLVISLCRAAKRGDDAMDALLAHAIAESPPTDHALRTLDLMHAAALLGVGPETLLAWEARYGFPTSSSSDRRYNRSDVIALRDCISDEASVAAAVARARQRARRRPRSSGWAADHRDGGLAS